MERYQGREGNVKPDSSLQGEEGEGQNMVRRPEYGTHRLPAPRCNLSPHVLLLADCPFGMESSGPRGRHMLNDADYTGISRISRVRSREIGLRVEDQATGGRTGLSDEGALRLAVRPEWCVFL